MDKKALFISGLNYSYPDGKSALRNIELSVEQNMRVALVGKNGSGKSTLLFHINGLLNGKGLIEVMGITRSKKTIQDMRKQVGFLFSQVEYQFIMPDLLNDIMLSIQDETGFPETKKQQAHEWLCRFDLEKYAASNPLDLSSGEMKRAALAAVLAKKPCILLLDEPLNCLDRPNAETLVTILNQLEVTMLIATHKRFLVEKTATHVALMQDGQIAGFFTKEEALSHRHINDLLF